MRFWLQSNKTLAVSVGGKSYKVQRDDSKGGRPMVEIPNDAVGAETLGHLLTKGWQIADDGTARLLRDKLGVKLADGQPVYDETASKALDSNKK